MPSLNILELIIAKSDEIIIRKQLQIEYPFFYDKITLTFGGSSKVVNSKIQEIEIDAIFHHFLVNILPLNLWQQNYNIATDIEFNQDKINYFISQVFQIKLGSFQISASYIHCINFKFNQIFASKNQILDIITFGQGIIQLVNVSIKQTYTCLISKSTNSGCININTQTSSQNLSLINIDFIKVQNRITSSIMTFSPSLIFNILLLKNVIIEDCFSLLNQIINSQFYQEIVDLNQITFQNIKIIQNLVTVINFFQSVKTLTSNEVLTITGTNNALIYQKIVFLTQMDQFLKEFPLDL